MKGLMISDIHSYAYVAKALFGTVNPDFVLDCGDHEQLVNLFEFAPHWYVHGNHEPKSLVSRISEFPVPNLIQPGQIIQIQGSSGEILRVSGIGGNYSLRETEWSVDDSSVKMLKSIGPGDVDVFLTHESPLDVSREIYDRTLAPKVLSEIERIRPSYVFAGHAGDYNSTLSERGIKFIRLPDIQQGHGLLEVNERGIYFEFIRQVYGSHGKPKS